MGNKVGRPTDSVKDYLVKARIDKETEEKLQYCIEHTNMSKSGVIRAGIQKIYEELIGEKEK